MKHIEITGIVFFFRWLHSDSCFSEFLLFWPFTFSTVLVIVAVFLLFAVLCCSELTMSCVASMQSLDLCIAYHCIVLWHHSTSQWTIFIKDYTEATCLCYSNVSTSRRVAELSSTGRYWWLPSAIPPPVCGILPTLGPVHEKNIYE